jgi:hypothetical protein
LTEGDSVRVEVAFDGGQIMSALVTIASADALERSIGAEGTLQLDAQDGRFTVALHRIVYAKRFSREARVGFGA